MSKLPDDAYLDSYERLLKQQREKNAEERESVDSISRPVSEQLWLLDSIRKLIGEKR